MKDEIYLEPNLNIVIPFNNVYISAYQNIIVKTTFVSNNEEKNSQSRKQNCYGNKEG